MAQTLWSPSSLRVLAVAEVDAHDPDAVLDVAGATSAAISKELSTGVLQRVGGELAAVALDARDA